MQQTHAKAHTVSVVTLTFNVSWLFTHSEIQHAKSVIDMDKETGLRIELSTV